MNQLYKTTLRVHSSVIFQRSLNVNSTISVNRYAYKLLDLKSTKDYLRHRCTYVWCELYVVTIVSFLYRLGVSLSGILF